MGKNYFISSNGERETSVLSLPLAELGRLSLLKLKSNKTLERAYKSRLYSQKWQATGINPETIETYEGFTKLPYLTGTDLRKAMYEIPIEEILCSKVVHWFSSSGTTGMPKWMPYGPRDIELFMQMRDRLYTQLTLLEKYKLVTVTSPPPHVEDGLAALNELRGILNKNPMESVAVSVTSVADEALLSFALDTKPNVLLGFPSFAARLAEIIEENAPKVAKQEFAKRHTAKNLLLYFATHLKKIRPKDVSKFSYGLFGGEPLDPYREVLAKAYGFEAYEIYLFTEFMPMAMECHMHNGMHMWLDICLPEIIPEAELQREANDHGYVPRAIPLWNAAKGLRGEYVLTTFGEALPLVRYRFGDLIEVVSTEPCGCGATHPRIKIPRKCDPATICLGAIRFKTADFEAKLLTKTAYGQAKKWQAQITRQGYRPKLIILLEPNGNISDEGLFLKEIQTKLMEVDILKTGVENKIIVEPQLKIATPTCIGHPATQVGTVIYEGESSISCQTR